MENHLWIIEKKTEVSGWHPMVLESSVGYVHYTRTQARRAMKELIAEECLYGRNLYRVRKYTAKESFYF